MTTECKQGVACFQCGEKGHMRVDCPKQGSSGGQSGSRGRRRQVHRKPLN